MGFIVGTLFGTDSQHFVMLYYHCFMWSQIFVILRDSPLLSCIWCQFAVLGRILLSEEILSKSSSSLIKKNIQCCSQSFKRFLFFLFGCFGINVHRSLDVFMPHNRLDNLQVGLFFAKPCTECVTQIVCRKVWKQNRITVLFLWCPFFARIVICNDSLDSTIYRLRIGDICRNGYKRQILSFRQFQHHSSQTLSALPAAFQRHLSRHQASELSECQHSF